MKNLFTILFLIFFVANSQSQTAVSGCSTVTLTSQDFDKTLINSFGVQSDYGPCKHYGIVLEWGKANFWLQKRNSSGQWIDQHTNAVKDRVPPLQSQSMTYGEVTYSNASKGVYRGRIQVPTLWIDPTCGTPAEYGADGHTNIGHQAVMSSNFYTNEVPVGPTDSNDNNFDFIDIYGTGSSSAFNDGETVYVDFSETKNYSQYYLSINEEGGTYNRWKDSNSGAWVHDLIDDTYDLSNMWSSGTGWDFEPLHTYHVNFVNDNSKCRNTIEYPAPTWNIRTKSFFVCPAGSGCREVVEERNFTIYPNPASNYIELGDFDPSVDSGYSLTLTSINGQTIKNVELSSDRIDISDLNSGMYIILLERNGQRVFQSKLMVSH